jgi:chromosome segregation ATPase
MKRPLTPLATAVVLALSAQAAWSCTDEQDRVDDTRKVIDETRDEAARARADIQDKEDELARDQGNVATDRAKFIAATEATLRRLDREMAQVRADVAARGPELNGEGRQDVEAGLAELENARAEAQAAFDRFRQTPSEQEARVRQGTRAAIERARSAYDALRGRVGDEDADPDMKGVDRAPVPPPPPATGARTR